MNVRNFSLRSLGFGLLLGASGGSLCNPVSIFACDTDEACAAEAGEGAVCQSNSYCTVVDEGCESGFRWYERSGGDLADTCYDPNGGGGGTADDGGSGDGSEGEASDGGGSGAADESEGGSGDGGSGSDG